MKRRDFLIGIGTVATLKPLAALAQPRTLRRIGSMSSLAADDPISLARLGAFRQSLSHLGWTEGREVEITYRYAAGSAEKMSANAVEFEALKPDVILVNGAPALASLVRVTKSIPIVFVAVSDPVADGFARSMAQPGGNVTGFTDYESATSGKWVQILRDVAPNLALILVANTPGNPSTPRRVSAIENAAANFGLKVKNLPLTNTGEFDASSFDQNSGLIALPSPYTSSQREALIKFSNANKIPAVFPFRYFATGGGLMSYGVDVIDLYRQAASYVSRILKGEHPADLPIQEPTKYELVLNLKAAKAMGIEVPAPLLVRADDVIEQ